MNWALGLELVRVRVSRAVLGAVRGLAEQRACSQSAAIRHLIKLGLACEATADAKRKRDAHVRPNPV